MQPAAHTLWLQPADATPAGCGGCVPSGAGPVCSSQISGQACATPVLDGDREQIRRVMASLRSVIDPELGRDIVDLQLVKSLRIADGEAELTVSFSLGCSSARHLAEGAFRTLRRVLPDTDVYVRHAA